MSNALSKFVRGFIRDDVSRGLVSRQSYEEVTPEVQGDFSPELPDMINLMITCPQCIEERPEGSSMEEYDTLRVGFTPDGIQVWCKRHGRNVVHVAR